jgi:predicted RNA binding protein YcfA (HicA-like mRNA interferase family)
MADRKTIRRRVNIIFSKTVPKGTLRAIIKQAGLSPEEFLRNL